MAARADAFGMMANPPIPAAVDKKARRESLVIVSTLACSGMAHLPGQSAIIIDKVLRWHNMFLTRIACVLSILCLAACDRLPESYPPPEQRKPVAGFVPAMESDAMMVAMDSSDADILIVKDIYGGTGISWRWTRKEPTVRIPLLSIENLKFGADFSLWDDSFKITGPLEISFLVNGKLLDKVRYSSPGNKHFEKPVPSDWLAGKSDAIVALSVDKMYTAPRDGSKYGVILTRVGLKP